MSDVKGQDRNTRIELGKGTGSGRLELKKAGDQGTVRQSFSHGRSKAVAVEVKRRRGPAARPGTAAAPAAETQLKAPAAPAPKARPAEPQRRSPSDNRGRRSGADDAADADRGREALAAAGAHRIEEDRGGSPRPGRRERAACCRGIGAPQGRGGGRQPAQGRGGGAARRGGGSPSQGRGAGRTAARRRGDGASRPRKRRAPRRPARSAQAREEVAARRGCVRRRKASVRPRLDAPARRARRRRRQAAARVARAIGAARCVAPSATPGATTSG